MLSFDFSIPSREVFFRQKPQIHLVPSILLHSMYIHAAAAAKSLQSCPTLCDPIDGSPPGSAVPGILQSRTPERVAISFSNVCKWKVKVKSLSHVWLFETPWTAAYQAPPPMGFSRQEHWSGLPLTFLMYKHTYIHIYIYITNFVNTLLLYLHL